LYFWFSKKAKNKSEKKYKQIPEEPVEVKPKTAEISKHGWGYSDTAFGVSPDNHLCLKGSRYEISGKSMPDFIPFIESEMDFKVNLEELKPAEYEIAPAPSRIENPEIDQWLTQTFGQNVSFQGLERITHSHGHTHEDMYGLHHGFKRVVDAVVWPTENQQILDLMSFAKERDDVMLLPFGGGTNVTNALECKPEEKRYIVCLDMRRMKKILSINAENRTAEVQAGAVGVELDQTLSEYGYHTGHVPDSNEFSTLGGWISTAASGMKQAKYGNIEDIVLSVKIITPTGELEKYELNHARTSTNFNIKSLVIGSEGNFGIIVSAIIRIQKIPPVQKYDSALFYTFEQGVEFFRALAETNAVPASIRLVDNRQFRFGQSIKPAKSSFKKLVSKLQKFYVLNLKKFDPYKMVACTIVFEGSKEEVSYQQNIVQKLVKQHQGMMAGAESGKSGYNLTYAIAYIRDLSARFDMMAESFETTVPWDKIHQVCKAVEDNIAEQHQKHDLAGKPFISYRISQIYQQSVCVYFYYAFNHTGKEEPAKLYSEIEQTCRQAIMDNGGSLSHHHGIGKIRQRFVDQVFDKRTTDLLRNIKKNIDPKNIMGNQNGIYTV
jgi:alkyldihydroxyacetonephosphate synthase